MTLKLPTREVLQVRVLKTAIVVLLAPLFLIHIDAPANAAAGYPNPGPNSSTQSLPATSSASGIYIIDAGFKAGANQTIAEGIKPYGLIYALVKAKIPVDWVINPNKSAITQSDGNTGADITDYECNSGGVKKSYRTGAFIIHKEFQAQAASLVTTWRAKGVKVDGPCTSALPNARVFATIKSWPRAVLDAQNGAVAVAYYTNAEIPQGSLTDPANPPAYRFATPGQLTPCDDMYVMPHADPTYATHSNLINFVTNGGSFYASCHAVSVIENMKYPAGLASYPAGKSAGSLAMNFLSETGTVLYDSHSQGSPAYAIYETATGAITASGNLQGLRPGDPLAQFYGRTDKAQQNGSEQIFFPALGSKWRDTTQLLIVDTSTADVPSKSAGPAATVLYGRAYGLDNAGLVLYQGAHSLNKGTTDDVNAQRIFFNFLLLSAVNNGAVASDSDRTPTVAMTNSSLTAAEFGQQIPVSGVATGGSGTYTYQWASKCYDGNGTEYASSGTFGNSASASTTFTAPTGAAIANCNLTLTVIDTCGRFAFGFQSISVAPSTDVRVSQSASATAAKGSTIEYTISVANGGKVTGTTSGDGKSASNVVLTGTIPSGATFDTVTSTSATCSGNSTGYLCTFSTIGDEETQTVTLKLIAQTTGTITNVANVTSESYDPNLTNNKSSVATTVSNLGVSITNTPSPSSVQASGTDVTYTFVVTNVGSLPLTNVVVTNDKCSPTRSLGGLDLAAGATSTWTCQRLALTSGDVDAATVTSTEGATSTSSSTVTSASATIQVTQTPESQTVASGSTAVLILNVKNTSGSGVTFTNVAVSNSYAAPSGSKCTVGNTTFDFPTVSAPYVIASLESGKSWFASCTLPTTVTTGSNNFVASAANPLGSGTKSDTATATITVATPNLTIEKTTKTKSVLAGDEIDYTLVVRNTTGASQGGVRISEVIPTGVTVDTVTVVNADGMTAGTGTSGLIAFDKFDGSLTPPSSSPSTYSSGTGWASSWSLTWSDSSTGSYITNTAQALKFTANRLTSTTYGSTRKYVYGASRTFYLSSANPKANMSFQCINKLGASGVVTYRIDTAAVVTLTASQCGSSEKQVNIDLSLFAVGNSPTTHTIQFTFTYIGSRPGNNNDYFQLNDLMISSGYLATESFSTKTPGTSSGKNDIYSGGSGFENTNWVESDSLSKLTLTSSEIKFAPSSTSDTATITGKYAIPTGVGSLRLSYICKKDSSAEDMTVKVNGGSNLAPSSCSTSNYETKTVTLSASGTISIVFSFVGNGSSKSNYLDEVSVTGIQDVASGSTTTIYRNASAFDQTYSINGSSQLSMTFIGKISANYSSVGVNQDAVINLAKVTGTSQLTPSAAMTSTPFDKVDISITKTADYGAIYSGDVVKYTYRIKNSGTTSLYRVSVSDESTTGVIDIGATSKTGDSNDPGVLNPNETWVFTRNEVVTTSDTTADATGKKIWEGTVSLNGYDSSTVTVDDVLYFTDSLTASVPIQVISPSVSISMTPTAGKIYKNKQMLYTYTVKPATGSDTKLQSISITDPACALPTYQSGDSDVDRYLDLDEEWIYTCLSDPLSASVDTRTVTVNANDGFLNKALTPATTTGYVNVYDQAGIKIAKVARDNVIGGAAAKLINIGESNTVVYTYTLSWLTDARTVLHSVALKDDACKNVNYLTGDDGDSLFEDGETWTYSCTSAQLYATTTSSVTASGIDPTDTKVQSEPDSTTATMVVPSLLLTVEPNKDYVEVGSPVTYTYGIQNVGSRNMSSITLSHVLTDTTTATVCSDFKRIADNTGDDDATLEVGETWRYTCVVAAVTEDTLSSFKVSIGDAGISSYHPDDAVTKVFAISPAITLAKTVGTSAAPTTDSVTVTSANTVYFQYVVTAAAPTPGTTLNSVQVKTITDNACPNVVPSRDGSGVIVGDSNSNGQLDPGENWTYTCTTTASAISPSSSSTNTVAQVSALSTIDDINTTNPVIVLTASASAQVYFMGSTITLYQITYNGNGATSGSVPVDATKYVSNDTVTVTSNSGWLLKTGYTFEGWLVNGVKYLPGESFNITGNVTATAIWEVPTAATPNYSISYNANGGSGSMASQTGTANSVTLRTNTFTNTGQVFTGWNTSSLGGGTSYSDGQSLSLATDVTLILYAQWSAQSTNSPSTNGGGSPIAKPILTWNDPMEITYPTPLSPTQLNATANVSGTYRYVPAAGTILPVGTHTLTVIFTPLNNPSEALTTTVQIKVVNVKLTPTLKWANPLPIAYPMPLSSLQLNAIASVPGTYKYTPASGTVLQPGTYTLIVEFTPTDSEKYYSLKSIVPLEVLSPAVVPKPTSKTGTLRFEVFFGMNSVVITPAEKKHIANEAAKIKRLVGSSARVSIVIEGWVQPNQNPGNIKYLSTYRAKHVALELQKLKVKGTYKLIYQGLGQDNLPKARHASVIITWTK